MNKVEFREAKFLWKMRLRDIGISKDSVFDAESSDIKILVRFHGSAILENFSKFIIAWVAHICVGCLSLKLKQMLLLAVRSF